LSQGAHLSLKKKIIFLKFLKENCYNVKRGGGVYIEHY